MHIVFVTDFALIVGPVIALNAIQTGGGSGITFIAVRAKVIAALALTIVESKSALALRTFRASIAESAPILTYIVSKSAIAVLANAIFEEESVLT